MEFIARGYVDNNSRLLIGYAGTSDASSYMIADSDEAAPLFRDDCAPGFRDDLAPLRLGSCWQ